MTFQPRKKLFRAFDPNTKKFIFTGFTILGEVNLLGALEIYKEENKALNFEETLELIITESTGVLDCKGVEIYEGDIVTFKRNNLKYTVEWVSDLGKFGLFHGKEQHHIFLKWCEVIGNVFENPDLLHQSTE